MKLRSSANVRRASGRIPPLRHRLPRSTTAALRRFAAFNRSRRILALGGDARLSVSLGKAYLLTCAVRGRDRQQPLNVDSVR